MKLFEKIRDLFTDEEEVVETREVEIEETKEHKLPTFMRNKIEKEEKEEEKKNEENTIKPVAEKEEVFSDRELIKTNSKFSFPIAFDENDFLNTANFSSQNILVREREKEKTVKELYDKKDIEKPKRFRATPIISPVYGVLEKNYKKDDVLEKTEDSYEIPRPSKKIDFETVRKKAFGTLTDDIKDNILCSDCDLLKEVKRVQKIEEDNLLKDILDDKEDISLERAAENYYDFGVAYEPPKRTEVNIDEIEININQDIKITDSNEEEPVGEKIEVKEKITDSYEEELEEVEQEDNDFEIIDLEKNKEEEEKPENKKEEKKKSKEEELELTDDLFNLIDSMYEERDD